jgi:LysM repeat protein
MMLIKQCFLISTILVMNLMQPAAGLIQAETPTPATHNATADELVYFTNLRRTQYGLSALTVNSILMESAQRTAEIMAGLKQPGHLGGATTNISEMGYQKGLTIYSTENVANGTDLSAEYIVYTTWNDDLHNIPVMNPIYCDIGAGVAKDSDGMSYYVLRAAYSEKRYCGEYRAPDGTTIETLYANMDTSKDSAAVSTGSQWMAPVSRVTPNPEGKIIHKVDYGQTLWSIAITYNTTIKQIQALNGYTEENQTVYVGQELVIPTSLTPYPTQTVTTTPILAISLTPSLILYEETETPSPEPQMTSTPIPQMQDESSVTATLFWAAMLGLLLVLLGILMKYMPGSQ